MRRQVAYVEKAFQTRNSYGFGQELYITEELYFIFVFLKRNTPDIKHHVGEDHINLRKYFWYFYKKGKGARKILACRKQFLKF